MSTVPLISGKCVPMDRYHTLIRLSVRLYDQEKDTNVHRMLRFQLCLAVQYYNCSLSVVYLKCQATKTPTANIMK